MLNQYTVSHSNIPTCKLLKPKKDTSFVFRQKLAKFKHSKQTGIEMHTDCSKDKNKLAASAVANKNVFSARLKDEANIFSADAKAIELAIEHIKMSKHTHFTIYLIILYFHVKKLILIG